MRIKIQKSTEDHEIPPKEDMVEIGGEMENRTLEDRKHIKDLIKCNGPTQHERTKKQLRQPASSSS